MIEGIHTEIEKAIIRSQHCQRNWDLSRELPQADIDLILTALTQCPSKQNVAHYKIHAITNRDTIEKIHAQTKGFTIRLNPYTAVTNTQVLANLLIVMEHVPLEKANIDKSDIRTDEIYDLAADKDTEQSRALRLRDAHMAVGVAAGYVNLTASMLGYATGCCACFLPEPVKEIVGAKNDILLMMGVGYKDPNLSRRVSQVDHDFVFPTMSKETIQVEFHR